MPHYINTQSLMALSETELRALYGTLYAEYQALPASSDNAAALNELLLRIQNMLAHKRRPQPTPQGPRL